MTTGKVGQIVLKFLQNPRWGQEDEENGANGGYKTAVRTDLVEKGRVGAMKKHFEEGFKTDSLRDDKETRKLCLLPSVKGAYSAPMGHEDLPPPHPPLSFEVERSETCTTTTTITMPVPGTRCDSQPKDEDEHLAMRQLLPTHPGPPAATGAAKDIPRRIDPPSMLTLQRPLTDSLYLGKSPRYPSRDTYLVLLEVSARLTAMMPQEAPAGRLTGMSVRRLSRPLTPWTMKNTHRFVAADM